MKRIRIREMLLSASVCGLTLGLGVLMTVTGNAWAQAPQLDRMDIVERSVPAGPVASVDGNPIEREEYLFLYHAHLSAMGASRGGGEIRDSMRVRAAIAALGELIQREILFLEALERGIGVPDSTVRSALEEEFIMLQDDMRRSGESVGSLEEMLERAGQSYDDAFDKMRKSLIIQQFGETLASEANISVSDHEVREFYESNPELFRQQGLVHIRQIFVKPQVQVVRQATEEQWAEARQRIEQALARIRAGESFEAVARAVSEAPNADQGGDLGMIPAAQLPPFYVEATNRLNDGDLSEIIRSEHGLHLIQLMGSEDEQSISLDDARDDIRRYLMVDKQEALLDDFVQPIITNQDRVKTYLQLERNLANVPDLEEIWAQP